MGKGLGIAALVVSIISIFIPLYGIFLGWLALLVVLFAALAGDITFTIAVVVISVINYIFLSPSLWIVAAGAHLNPKQSSSASLIGLTAVLVIVPMVALILRQVGKRVFRPR
jgi:hypothetical protein